MKKILSSIVLLILFGVEAFAFYYSSDHSYFTWEDGRGLILHNGNQYNHLFVHYHNGRFYCDEACTIECIGLGHDNGTFSGGIGWMAIVDGPVGTTGSDVERMGRTNVHSPHDLTQFFTMFQFAATTLNNLGYGTNPSSLHLHICMHDNYLLDNTEYSTLYVENQTVYTLDWGLKISSQCTITRKDGLTGALININSRHTNQNINFNPGYVVIDNNTTSDNDIAILVNHGTLLMAAWAQIINSKATSDDKTTYHGIGVKVIDNGLNTHAPAVELGYDASEGLGTFKIYQQKTGIDMQAGVLRFKMSNSSNPVSLGDNVVAVNMVHGASLSKWADNISSFFTTDWLISLQDPTQWRSGDILFTSGQSRAGGALHNTPLTQTDISAVHFAPGSNLEERYEIVFDNSISNSQNYMYPMFLLSKRCIFNTRTMKWYATLYNALNDALLPVQDGDNLVYYGNVLEQHNVVINNNLTIRSAMVGTDDENAEGKEDAIDSNGYTSTWSNANGVSTYINVAAGKSVSIGGTNSGSFTINLGSKGRGFDVNGTLNILPNFTLTGGNRPSGAGINIQNGGVVNMSGGALTNHTASTQGGAFNVNSTGTLNITGGTITGCTSPLGAGVYQGGTMNLQGNVNFGSTLPVYLPTGKVITKTGAISATGTISASLQNEIDGRDILVSAAGATSNANGMVNNGTDLSLIDLNLSNNYTFRKQYNATGNDNGSANPKNVIELTYQLKDLTITKSGLQSGDNAIFTVTEYGSATPAYTVNVSGASNSVTIKDLPAKQFTVTEVTNWSWAYSAGTVSKTQNIGSNPNFSFSNTAKTGAADHAEDAKVNTITF